MAKSGRKDCTLFISKEQQRYTRKGYGLIFAFFIWATFMCGVPALAQLYWPALMVWREEQGLSYTGFLILFHMCTHTSLYIGANAVYQVYYHFEFPFIEKYKTNYQEEWPWNEDAEQWHNLIKKALPVFLLNSVIIMPSTLYIMSFVPGHVQHSMDNSDLPSPILMAGQILFCMLCEDFTFYWGHRTLHSPFFYKHIHKYHHRFTTTVGLAAEYAHPVEYLLANLLPTSVGPAILGPQMHLVAVLAWYAVRTGESLDGHCGYDFSFSPYRLIPFSGSASYHDFHHSSNVGNYGSFFSIWDTVCGTNKPFYDYQNDRMKFEQEKKEKIQKID